ncbi:MAG: hypothetical protein E7I99_02710 [Streptococcus mitis]|nr:hypothetical protein [Streptococcus mitis]
MKFEVSPIIFKTKVIEAFDADLSFPINLKSILNTYTFVSHIENLSLLFSTEEIAVLQHLNKYFNYDSNVANFTQVHLFLFKEIETLNKLKNESLFSYKNTSVYIGKSINENTVYLIDDCVYIEKDNGGSLTNIYYSKPEDLKHSFPIIIKIIESIVSEYFLIKGFLPIHCSTGVSCKTGEVYLILGESKSGKTTFFTENEDFKLIGDEYCFFREDRIVPFDLYYKSYCWENEDFDEEFDDIKRKVLKISKKSERQIKSVDKIIYIKDNSSLNYQLITDESVKLSILMEYLSNFPGKIYLNDIKKYFPLVISATKKFFKIPVYLK